MSNLQGARAAAPEPTIGDKVRFLSDPAVWPEKPAAVLVTETHMSWVFLAGDRVLKLKKPVSYPFLDFSTLALRRHFVSEEVRLNRRLAPEVYLGKRPLTVRADGALALDGSGRTVDWLVEMRRLPEDSFLDRMIERGAVTPAHIARIAETLVAFYGALPPAGIDPESYLRRFADEQVETARVLRDPTFAFDGARVDSQLRALADALETTRDEMTRRVAAGRIVEGHGDLRPEHICLTDPPAIIDCLEFSPALRAVDPVEELVFLGLDCTRLGADWILSQILRRVCGALGKRPSVALLAFHWRYRALLRARLALLHLVEPEPRTPEKWRPLAWRYIELAEQADRRAVAWLDQGA